MDWVDLILSEPAEEREEDMSCLTAGFVVRIRKRVASAQIENAFGFGGLSGKRPKWSGPNQKAQKSPVVITLDSPERTLDALMALEGASQDTSKAACASLEDGAPAEGPPNADQAISESLAAETTIGPPLQTRRYNLTIPDAHRANLPDRLMIGSYVKLIEQGSPSMDTPTLGPNEARTIINNWNPFNNRDSFTIHMCKLYPNLLRIPVVTHIEYFIPFPSYMDKKSYQRVANDEMIIRNHDFDKSTELV